MFAAPASTEADRAAAAMRAAGRSHRLTVLLLIIVAAVLALQLPYWLVSAGPRDQVFGGTFRNIYDTYVYVSAAEQARQSGAWLYTNHFTAEPHRPVFAHGLYLAAGHLSAATGVSTEHMLSGLSVMGRLVALLALYTLAATLYPPGQLRWLAWAAAAFGGSLSIWAFAASLLAGATPAQFVYFEDDLLTVLFSAPHLQWGMAALLFFVAALPRARARPPWIACLLLVTSSIGFLVPYALAPLLLWLWLDTLLMARSRQAVLLTAAVTLAALPWVLYSAATFSGDPFWGTILGAQNEVPRPQGLHLFVHLGVLLPLAIFSPFARHGAWTPRARSLALLAMVTFLLLFSPVPYQRRLAFGLLPELGLLSAPAIAWLLGAPRGPLRSATVLVLALAVFGTTLFSYAAILQSAVTGRPYPVYVATTAAAEGARALAVRTTEGDATLATLETSYALVPSILGRVVLGHPHETLDFRAKELVVQAFFRSTRDEERAELLQQLRATVLFVGPRERAVLSFDPGTSALFENVWKSPSGDVAIFRVRATGIERASG